MREELVSFQTAKLAKEKGFNELVRHYFLQDGELYGTISLLKDDDAAFMNGNELEYHNHKDFDRYSAPTQSLLQKWLREVHNVNIDIETHSTSDGFSYSFKILFERYGKWKDFENSWYTYEEALEVGLQEALKLI